MKKLLASLGLLSVLATASVAATAQPVVLPELQVKAPRAESLDATLKAGIARMGAEAASRVRQDPLAGIAAPSGDGALRLALLPPARDERPSASL